MSTPQELEETIEAGVATLEPRASALRDPGDTIMPALATATGPTIDGRARALVNTLARVQLEGDGARLVLGEVLGEGGMGLVRVAEQTSLGRKVAIKSIRAASLHDSEAATGASDPGEDPSSLKLLHEAWVTGALEHPNIVPVHDVVLDPEGHPMIVLKRIEGVTWSELIQDAAAVRERFGAKDLLDWNLRIFTQVCNAVSFAHSRGIIHRDLKPQNVMIGGFGEVYVLDWGVAVALHEGDLGGRLRLARDVREVAGTPLYMAPEMLTVGVDGELSERTDVYLLGAILHEIITGRPPHAPKPDAPSLSVQAFVSSVLEFRPEFASDARGELTAICRRALEHEPARRHASAAELRVAIEDFLLYRGSTQVAEHAQDSLERLIERVRACDPKPTSSATIENAGERRDIYNLYGECRFGFEAAMRVWPENQVAIEGLRRAQIVMIEYETRCRDLKAAATLLAQLDDPPAALRERVAQLERDTEAARRQAQQLVRLGRDMDLRTGQRTRTTLALLIGLVFTLTPLLRDPTLRAATHAARLKMLIWPVAFLVIVSVIYLVKRRTLVTAINRRLYGGVMLALAAQIALHISGMLLDVPIHVVHVMLFGLWFCVVAMMAIAVNPRLVYSAIGYLVGFFVAARWPELRFYAMAGANLMMTINGTALWLSYAARRTSGQARA
ncbi:MAG: protein kinase [Myxococcales bacterium]|nr:protein kinase [Myxococcales bacterium]